MELTLEIVYIELQLTRQLDEKVSVNQSKWMKLSFEAFSEHRNSEGTSTE